MTYEQLLSEGRIKRHTASAKGVQEQLSLADRDLAVALHTLEVDPDWAFSIAYNCVLQASRAYMFQAGYRPRGRDQHATVFLFLREAPAAELVDMIATADQMRRKRHQAVYDATGRIGAAEAKQAVQFAEQYLAAIRKLID